MLKQLFILQHRYAVDFSDNYNGYTDKRIFFYKTFTSKTELDHKLLIKIIRDHKTY